MAATAGACSNVRRLLDVRLGVAAAVVDGALVRGDVEIRDGVVAGVGLAGRGAGVAIPGLVDLQVNGYAGIDVHRAEAGELVELGHALAVDGVLWYQPTVVTAAADRMIDALTSIGQAFDQPAPARMLGAHLEGPFLNASRAGAHDADRLRRPALDALAALLLAGCPVTMVTLAPELDDADELIDALTERGIVVSLGHSDATAAVAHAAFDAGARSVTHLFNAMRPFHHRDPGLAGAALSRVDVTVMIVADGVHVATDALLTAWSAAHGRLVLVSDAIAATAFGDGAYSLGGREIVVEDGVARLADGTLAGSARPLAWGLRLLVELGVPVDEAVDAVTRAPARLLGRDDIAVLRPGAPADLVVLDDAFAVDRVYVGGRELTTAR
jgi:N-acetylglucosamine-6-phosphate deacetylase